MVSVAEAAANAQTPLADALSDGVRTLSYNQQVTFTKYVRVVLPLDGFVFWVKADQLSEAALFNFGAFNTAPLNQSETSFVPAPTIAVKGSLHYRTENRQDEDSSISRNTIIFTSLSEIEELSQMGPTVSYIGDYDGLRFHFSQQTGHYDQAGLWHYVGDAVYSTLATQIIDNAALLDTKNVVVSNSLPIWLSLTKYMPVYPSFLVPDNLPPPYAAVHIYNTEPLQPIATEDEESNSNQLCRERVRITTFGLRNYTAQDYLRYLMNHSRTTDDFGFCYNMPAWRDEKDGQVEISAIAQKKTLELDISYYQTRMRNIARQFILSATCTTTIGTY